MGNREPSRRAAALPAARRAEAEPVGRHTMDLCSHRARAAGTGAAGWFHEAQVDGEALAGAVQGPARRCSGFVPCGAAAITDPPSGIGALIRKR